MATPRWIFALGAPAVLSLALVAAPGGAQELDEGELMNRMVTAYKDIVEMIFLFPVQESGDEAPFGKVEKRLSEIAETARLLPALENYKKDNSFAGFAKSLENLAGELTALAKKKDQAVSAAALWRLQAACLNCHKNFRF